MLRKLLRVIHALIRAIVRRVLQVIDNIYTRFMFYVFDVQIGSGFQTKGRPIISISDRGRLQIGNDLRLNNGLRHNRIGRQQPCFFIVNGGHLSIGNNVGMSGTAIVCWQNVRIGNNVRIGGNTVIYDTDFHSLDPMERRHRPEDRTKTKTRPVVIGDDVFIGAHSIILKGVEIGDRAIVGAGSVVTKSVPSGEIWAGNPARPLRKAETTE